MKIPRRHLDPKTWIKKYKEAIGDILLTECRETMLKGEKMVIVEIAEDEDDKE